MTLENCEKLIKHYEDLIENPDKAFPANARVKPQGRESVIAEAKNHLEDMKRNLEIRKYLKENKGVKLNQATVLKKLKVPGEAKEKDVIPKEEKKEKSKKKKD